MKSREKTKRENVYRRDKGICQLCHEKVLSPNWADKDPSSASIDHRIPRCLEGTGHIDNLQLAHKVCNFEKGASFSAINRISLHKWIYTK